MRHNVSGKKLGRDSAHRKALKQNLATSLVEHGSVETTLVKAKYVRPFVEKLVTKARKGDFNAVRAVRKGITTEDMVRKLVKEIAPQFAKRPGGYTRIRKLGKRRDGDNAPMARIEWVIDVKPAKKEAKKVEAKVEKEEKKPTKKPKAPAKKKTAKKEEKKS
jgi:large subunit ribosomal protein L17